MKERLISKMQREKCRDKNNVGGILMNNFNKLNVFIMHLGYIILFGFVLKNY